MVLIRRAMGAAKRLVCHQFSPRFFSAGFGNDLALGEILFLD
jgi:hypothetical protein